ncbi:MAG: hypothetical protein QM734_13540 [Cyclobacteriaceae bacterium]
MKQLKVFLRSMFGLIIVILLTRNDLHAQYNTALGIRMGGTTGIDGKFFTRQSKAVEAIVGWFGNGSSVTVLFEKYSPVYNARGLYVYYGGGPHVAFYDGGNRHAKYFGRDIDYRRSNDFGMGIDGIIGFEYRMPDGIPISFSLDLKPFVELGSSGYIGFAPDPSIGIKFILR